MGYDAIVVGSGPNGLAAAVALAREGRSVLLREGASEVGGGLRSAELTEPGVVHDVCATIHPLAAGSPFLRSLPLAEHGLELIRSPAPLAHPLDDGTAAVLERGVAETAAALVEDDERYSRVVEPLVRDWERIEKTVLGPVAHVPRHPFAALRFGLQAVRSADGAARSLFEGERARALFAGCAGHAMLPFHKSPTASFAWVLLVLGHAVGWPLVRGGSQRLAEAMASYLRSLGGEIETDAPVRSLGDLPRARAVLCDVSPGALVDLAGDRLPPRYRRRLLAFRRGLGAFKVDWLLDGPVPWRAAGCARAACLHLGGGLDEIADAERLTWEGGVPERPFVIFAQQTLFDGARAPAGRHTAWAYCHVPNGSRADMTERLERQVERFAPGFRDRIVARSVMSPEELERHDPNFVGGDVSGGAMTWGQLLARPAPRVVPYSTPVPGLFLCSSSTPPGGGVHGMCGYLAARAALRTALA